MGYDLQNLAPQLFPTTLPSGLSPPTLQPPSSILGAGKQATNLGVQSGFLAYVEERHSSDAIGLSAPPRSALKKPNSELIPRRLGAASDPPFGKGILVSRLKTGQAVVSSVPSANSIYKDVFTTVFNESHFLPFSFVLHSSQQDAFYFVKERTLHVTDDQSQLKRLGGQVNTTFHDNIANGYTDVKIHGPSYVINLRYGTTPEKERQRLLHHAKTSVEKKAWHREENTLKVNGLTSEEWTQQEQEEITKSAKVNGYEVEYVHDPYVYPELAEDPYNVRFVKKPMETAGKRRRRRKVSTNPCALWWLDKFC